MWPKPRHLHILSDNGSEQESCTTNTQSGATNGVNNEQITLSPFNTKNDGFKLFDKLTIYIVQNHVVLASQTLFSMAQDLSSDLSQLYDSKIEVKHLTPGETCHNSEGRIMTLEVNKYMMAQTDGYKLTSTHGNVSIIFNNCACCMVGWLIIVCPSISTQTHLNTRKKISRTLEC